MTRPQCTGGKLLEVSCHGGNIERFIFERVRFDRSNATIQWIIPFIRFARAQKMKTIVSFSLATIQIVIARNRDCRHLGLRGALSARGKHLLLKCTLRSAGASIFQRALELFVFTASPSNYRRWAHVASGRRAINRSIISSRTASLLDNGGNENPFRVARITREDKTDKTIFASFRVSSTPRNFRGEKRKSGHRCSRRSFRQMNSDVTSSI